MLCYLMGTLGVIIALLGSHTSPYAAFHVRQSLKFTVLDILLLLIGLIFFWTVLVPIACAICYVVLGVVRIICFFSICKGNAKEPPIWLPALTETKAGKEPIFVGFLFACMVNALAAVRFLWYL